MQGAALYFRPAICQTYLHSDWLVFLRALAHKKLNRALVRVCAPSDGILQAPPGYTASLNISNTSPAAQSVGGLCSLVHGQSLLTDGLLRAGSAFVEWFYAHVVGVKRTVYGVSRKAFRETRGCHRSVG